MWLSRRHVLLCANHLRVALRDSRLVRTIHPSPTPTRPSSFTCPTERNVGHAIAATIDVGQRVAHVAANQHGRASHWQLDHLGLNANQIAHRKRAGSLHQVHHGVYAIGYPSNSLEAQAMGAVLANGPGSLASHFTGTQLLEIRTRLAPGEPEVIVSTPGGRAHEGITVHRCCRIHPLDRTVVRGIPTTTGPRTLMDCGPRLGEDRLHEVAGHSYRAGSLHRDALISLLDRSRGLRGVAMLRAATEELWMDPDKLRSELERRFLALCLGHPTPPPLINHRMKVEGRWIEVDFYWPDYDLVVETDGFAFHSNPHAHEEDRRRDQDLKLMGIDVFRYTWRQVTRQPYRVDKLFNRYFPY